MTLRDRTRRQPRSWRHPWCVTLPVVGSRGHQGSDHRRSGQMIDAVARVSGLHPSQQGVEERDDAQRDRRSRKRTSPESVNACTAVDNPTDRRHECDEEHPGERPLRLREKRADDAACNPRDDDDAETGQPPQHPAVPGSCLAWFHLRHVRMFVRGTIPTRGRMASCRRCATHIEGPGGPRLGATLTDHGEERPMG